MFYDLYTLDSFKKKWAIDAFRFYNENDGV